MMKLAIVHTTPITVETLKALAAELLPGYEVINFVDDSILPQLRENGGNLHAVEKRLIQYMKFAEEVGANIILNACSSVGELVAVAQPQVHIPIVRIDEAMAEAAAQRGQKIGVAATLQTTLRPTVDLIKSKAPHSTVESLLVSEAYQKLMAGDKDGHDRVLAQALQTFVQQVEVVVLAQASMARVVATLPTDLQSRFLSSPRLGMERVKAIAEASHP